MNIVVNLKKKMAFKKLSENLIYSQFKQGETHNLY